MARTICLLLILTNALALAWIYWKGDERIDAGREPARAKSELVPQKIRLIVPAESSPQALAPVAAETISTVAMENCRAYAGATTAEAQEIEKLWSQKLVGAHVTAIPEVPSPTFEMVVAGLASRGAAETKLAELKKFGIGDGVLVRPEDDKRFSVVVASYREKKAADDALKIAGGKGVRSAVIVQRQAAPERSMIEVRGNDASLKVLAELASAHKGLTSVECATR